MFSRALPAFVLSLALVAFADPDPIVPDPGHIYNEGATCEIGWNPDPTGTWKTMNIELMTGSNSQMVHLSSSYSSVFFFGQATINLSYPLAVATVDGTTTPGTFSYPCPPVRLSVSRSHF